MDDRTNLFGHIITGAGRPTPSFLGYHVRPLSTQVTPSPGMMLAVSLGPAQGYEAYAMARISNAWETNPYEDAASATLEEVLPFKVESPAEGRSTVIYRVIQCEPLEEVIINPETGELRDVRPISRLPRAGAEVFLPWGDLTARTLGLEPNPDLALDLGLLHGSDIPARITRDAIQRHIAIVGAIGSGKSYTRGVLAEELHRLSVPQVNLDVNGEMVGRGRRARRYERDSR